MMYFGIIKLSFQALRENGIRSFLTALGIIVGTAIVVIVLSVGEGIKSLIFQQVSNITSESLAIETQVPSKGNSIQKAQNSAIGIEITTLSLDDFEDISRLPNFANGFPMLTGQGKFVHRNTTKTTIFFAVGHQYADSEKLKIAKGRFFTQEEDASLARVVVLGSELKNILFGNEQAIGKRITVNQQQYQVVGIAEEMGLKFFLNVDEMAYFPVRTAQKKILGIDHLSTISIKMKNKNFLDSTISQIENILRKNHNIKDSEKDDFVIRTADEAMDIIGTITTGVSLLLFALASISLIVGGVGIMNVMYVSVTERTNEIGLKKAIGASPFAIRIQFIIEAVFLSVSGGIIGIIMGTIISKLVSVVAQLFAFDWPFLLPMNALLLSFGISFLIGVLFGYAPAKKAAQMNPIDALRKS
jgi:putative ABC transport system permease protein